MGARALAYSKGAQFVTDLMGRDRPSGASTQSALTAGNAADDEVVSATLGAVLEDVHPAAFAASWHPASDEIAHVFRGPAHSGDTELEREMLTLAQEAARSSVRNSETILHTQPHPRGTVLLAIVPVADSIFTVAALVKAPGATALAKRRRSFVRMLPAFEGTFRSWLAQRMILSELQGLKAAVDCSGVPMFILSRRGEVLVANKAGEALLSLNDGLYQRRGLLSGPTLAETLRLQTTLEHLFSGSAKDAGGARVVVFERAKRRPLIVTLALADSTSANPHGGTAVAYVSDPEHDFSPFMEPACKFFGLSASETKLACLLTQGGTLADAATALGVREQTVRSYLKQIFSKTGTNRQAELVSLLLKSAVPVVGGAKLQFTGH